MSYATIAAANHPTYWDPGSDTPWTTYQVGTQWHKTYYDDPTSMALKAQLANFFHIAGVGIWALGMDGNDPAMLAALTGNAPVTKDTLTGPRRRVPAIRRWPPSTGSATWPSTRSPLRLRVGRHSWSDSSMCSNHRSGPGLPVDRSEGGGVVVLHHARGLRGDGRHPDRLRYGRLEPPRDAAGRGRHLTGGVDHDHQSTDLANHPSDAHHHDQSPADHDHHHFDLHHDDHDHSALSPDGLPKLPVIVISGQLSGD